MRFNLREGATFQDGTPVDAEAVQWCLQYWQGPKTPFNREYRGVTSNIIDKYTIDVKTAKPNALLLDRMIRHVVPKGALTRMSEAEFGINPIGAGPYQFEKWIKGERIVLKRWDNYFGKRPFFDKMEYRFILEQSIRLSALFNNEIDIMPHVPSFLAKQLVNRKDIQIKTASSVENNILALKCVAPSPLQDVRLRWALAHAIDVDEMINQLLGGYAERTSQIVTKVFFGHNPNIEPYPYKPQKAKELLAKAGYKKGLDLTMDSSNRYREQSEALVGYWKDVGINVKLNILEDAVYGAMRRSGMKGGQKNDILYLEFGHSVLDDLGIMIGLTSKIPFNTTGYKNPELDKLYYSTVSTVDQEERLKLAHKCVEISVRDLPWLPLYNPQQIWGLRKNISYQPGPLNRHPSLYDAKMV